MSMLQFTDENGQHDKNGLWSLQISLKFNTKLTIQN